MFSQKIIKSKIKSLLNSPFVLRLISTSLYYYAQLVAYTTHWKYIDKQENHNILTKQVILVGWHSRVVMLPFFWRKFSNKNLYALVSPHQDGQLIANFLKLYGISPISGSTDRKAQQSALEIMHLLQKGDSIFISPDGPRGPRMVMKKSPIYYAAKTGLPIVFACFSTSHARIMDKTWDKTMLVKPFGKGIFALSQPFYVPKDLTEDKIEEYRLKLENIANDLCQACDKQVGQTPIMPAAPDEFKKKRF